MTIRRRLSFSNLAIILLLGCNLVMYFYSGTRRKAQFEELRRAIQRQDHINAIQQELNNDQKHISLLNQVSADSGGGGASPDEIAQFNSRLDGLTKLIEQVRAQSTGESAARVDRFAAVFHDLNASWRIFYENFGRDQSRAITEQVIRGDPLSQEILQKLLPELQKVEKAQVE